MRKSEKSNSFPVPLGDLLMGARPACSEHWVGRENGLVPEMLVCASCFFKLYKECFEIKLSSSSASYSQSKGLNCPCLRLVPLFKDMAGALHFSQPIV